MDNTVGSLTQKQKSIIIGSILGDGYLRIIKGRQDAFLEINHSAKQRAYVDWKFSLLNGLVAGKPKFREGRSRRVAYRFYTKQHPQLTKFYGQFYQRGKKFFPEKIKLNPIILAVWFMDDGSKCRSSDVYINTQQFDNESQRRMITALSGLGLQACLNKDKTYYRIRFIKSSLPKLEQLIKRHIIPSMRYKIEL
jgi:hypothetical protein